MTLKVARVAAGYTQKEAAKLLGVSVPAVCAWETGTAEPRAGSFMAACELYGVDPKDIFLPSRDEKVREKK